MQEKYVILYLDWLAGFLSHVLNISFSNVDLGAGRCSMDEHWWTCESSKSKTIHLNVFVEVVGKREEDWKEASQPAEQIEVSYEL